MVARQIALLALVCFVWLHAANAQEDINKLSVSPIFGDGMVLQQGGDAPVWGTAAPKTRVRVELDGVRARARADKNGQWHADLSLEDVPYGGPHTLSVKTRRDEIVFENVLIGEVWIASGQSNMEWPLSRARDAEAEIAAANFPNIRLFKLTKGVSGEPLTTLEGQWTATTPESAKDFSAVAYFFGRRLHQELDGVPVGLIQTAWGGTPAESWTSMEKLQSIPELEPILARWEKIIGDYPAAQAAHEDALKAWEAARDQAKAEGKDEPQRPQGPMAPDHPHRAAGLYNAMIHPIVPYGIRGAIWYQGESNAGRAYQYRTLFPAMIEDWRERWDRGPFPFLFVQLANFTALKIDPAESDWAELREAQSMTLSLPNTGQAVIIDIGEAKDIHPANKQDVGSRLAQSAFKVAYGMPVVDSGPIYKSMTKEGNAIRVQFDHVHGGLMVYPRPPLLGFAIAGSDRVFHWADAQIDEESVVVRSEAVGDPVAVRYAWENNPACNLYNADGLPASPFRTDDWPGVTINNK